MQPVIDAVTNACQLISGWRQTTPAAEWSEFDETTYQNLGKALQSLHATRPDGGDSLREALATALRHLELVTSGDCCGLIWDGRVMDAKRVYKYLWPLTKVQAALALAAKDSE